VAVSRASVFGSSFIELEVNVLAVSNFNRSDLAVASTLVAVACLCRFDEEVVLSNFKAFLTFLSAVSVCFASTFDGLNRSGLAVASTLVAVALLCRLDEEVVLSDLKAFLTFLGTVSVCLASTFDGFNRSDLAVASSLVTVALLCRLDEEVVLSNFKAFLTFLGTVSVCFASTFDGLNRSKDGERELLGFRLTVFGFLGNGATNIEVLFKFGGKC